MGEGAADGDGNGGALNTYDGAEATYDYSDGGEWWGYGWYEGELIFAKGEVNFGPYTGGPWPGAFSVTASQDGGAQTKGKIVVDDPDFYWSSFEADGYYFIRGDSEIGLEGDIADRE
jgi:hypothetical protein